jgi:hypothetical protein
LMRSDNREKVLRKARDFTGVRLSYRGPFASSSRNRPALIGRPNR